MYGLISRSIFELISATTFLIELGVCFFHSPEIKARLNQPIRTTQWVRCYSWPHGVFVDFRVWKVGRNVAGAHKVGFFQEGNIYCS